jgi:polyisoprenoid-binding protein YceI
MAAHGVHIIGANRAGISASLMPEFEARGVRGFALGIRPVSIQIEWSVRYLGIATVKGIFRDVRATLEVDDEDPRKWSTTITIAAASLDSGYQRMDDHVRTADFLDVETYPTIQFSSSKVEVLSEEPGASAEEKPPGVTDWKPRKVHLRVHGELTLRGITRPAELDAWYFGQAKDVRGRVRRSFTARTSVQRSDFNINQPPQVDPANTVSGNVINLAIDVIATKVDA